MVRSLLPLFSFGFAASAPVLAVAPVPLPHFNSVELRGGGSVTLMPGRAQRVALLEGSTRFTRMHVERGSLIIDTCTPDCPHFYRLRVEIQSPAVPNLGVSGGGSIGVGQGFAPQAGLSAAVNGGGRIDARAVEVGGVLAAVNGGGELLVQARSTLSGAVRGGGLVRYWGNPAVTTAVAGGGAVKRAY